MGGHNQYDQQKDEGAETKIWKREMVELVKFDEEINIMIRIRSKGVIFSKF